ncbi:MAG: cytochrome P450 [Microthrixaceae bacterium]|nr:cytochrome P450 [Microthrixaceae bacterium]MCO5313157.1 cytochrome P450 [Microthrixaceae bacterium]
MTVHYSPYDYESHENPYPIYARLRSEAPLYRNDDLNFYALSRHEDVGAGFRDSARFSSADGVSLDKEATGPHAYKTMSFLAMDPPRHTRMRALVARGFTPRRVVELEGQIREIAIDYLDGARDGEPYDIIKDFAGRMPMDVISEMMGVPKADRDEIRRLADLLVHREEGVEGVPAAGIEAAMTLFGYYDDMVAQRRKTRTDDLTSALIDAEIDDEKLAHDEIVAFLFLMVVAGNETTTKLLGNALYWAWRNPDQRDAVWSGQRSVEEWIEETLRYDTSSQVLARTTTEDVEIAGGVIPAGSRVLLLAGSANHDETVFDAPEEYRIGRDTSQILSFGVGRHFCMGASLARLEAKVALEEFVARVAGYELDPSGIERVHSVNVRGFSALPSTLALRAAS